MIEITKDTKVSDILREYGDIADVMEVFGIKWVGGHGFRKFLTKTITVQTRSRTSSNGAVGDSRDCEGSVVSVSEEYAPQPPARGVP